MKTKTYRNGNFTCRSYLKNAGNGWEVGFTYGAKSIFVGNFIHSWEANTWYATMNREIRNFAKKYKVAPTFSKTNYGRFLASHLYNKYYLFLDRIFTQHTRAYRRQVTRNYREFQATNRRTNVAPATRAVFLKAA